MPDTGHLFEHEENESEQSNSWIGAVAARAGVTVDEASQILREWRIDPSASYPSPRHLHLTHIKFSGERPEEGTANPGPFEFDWSGLGPGIWALSSEVNSAGKTSVLEIAMWALRGDPKNLAPDVRIWLEQVDVGFELNGVPHRVAFEVRRGAPSGVLLRIAESGDEMEVMRFDTSNDFEEGMGSFMMSELGLHKLRSWNATTEQPTEHGWNALTGALYITRKQSDSLLGDLVIAGLAGRLLQVFLGVPWTQTVFNARTARDAANARRTRARATGADPARRQAIVKQRDSLQAELTKANTQTGSLVKDTVTAFSSLTKASRELAEAEELVLRLTSELVTAQAAESDLKRDILDRSETALAARFFQGLNPALCPRCDTHIDDSRRSRETTHHECSVCQTQVEVKLTAAATADEGAAESDQDPLSVDELKPRLVAAAESTAAVRTALTEARAARDLTTAIVSSAHGEVEAAQAGEGALATIEDLTVRIARLQGALDEIESAATIVDDTVSAADSGYAVLSAALAEANSRLKASRGDLFDDLNRLTTEIGEQLGVVNLTGVEIDGAARVKVHKGGATSNFSSCSPGEQLRLRVAVVVAMLHVGQARGVGRHPGLLIVDSPAAEETSENDAGMIMDNLLQITKLIPSLQVIAATARPALIEGVVTDAQVKRVEGSSRLW